MAVPAPLDVPHEFISLQDMCKLYLLATIDEYPVDVLAKLPLHMRKKLFMAMPVIDRLHFVGTVFLDGLEVKHNVAVPDHNQLDLNDPVFRNSNEVYLCPWLTTDSLKQELAHILLPVRSWNWETEKLFALNFPLGCFNSFHVIKPAHSNSSFVRYSNWDDVVYCIKSFNLKRCKQGLCIKTSIINVDRIEVPTVIYFADTDYKDFIIPSRLTKFIQNTALLYLYQGFEIESTHVEAFIEYCQLWFQIPKVLKISCNENHSDSPLWRYFLTRRTQPDGGRVVYSYLTKLLSPVETLQLSSPLNDSLDVSILRKLIFPIIRLCAGHNMESRSLKHIEITSTSSLEAALDMLICVKDFLSGKNCNGTMTFKDTLDDQQSPTPFDFHHNELYLIESLSINVKTKVEINFQQRGRNLNLEAISKSLMEIVGDVLVQQLKHLKHVTVKLSIEIHELNEFEEAIKHFSSHCYSISRQPCIKSVYTMPFRQPCTESVYIIMPILIDFIRQPQFQSLALNVLTPDLYHAFITTPATHDQLLAIDSTWAAKKPRADTPGNPHNVPVDQPHLSHWPHINPSDIPFSNLTFKSLDLGSFDSQWNKEVVAALPILRLNMLRIPFNSLLSVREDAIIEVSHVKIDFTNWTHDSLSEVDYENTSSLFLRHNQYLSTLELFSCKLVTLPLVNHYLEQIIRSGPVPLYNQHSHKTNNNDSIRTLVLNSIHVLCSPALPPLRQQALEEIHIHLDTPLYSYVVNRMIWQNDWSSEELRYQEITTYNQTLLKLFTLIRNLGDSQHLVITANDVIYSLEASLQKPLLEMIVERSGDGRMKQIVLKGYDNLSEDLPIFKLIAEEVVVDS